MTEEQQKWLENECRRYRSDFCGAAYCLKRGGWVTGEKASYDQATCIPYEILQEIQQKDLALIAYADRTNWGSIDSEDIIDDLWLGSEATGDGYVLAQKVLKGEKIA